MCKLKAIQITETNLEKEEWRQITNKEKNKGGKLLMHWLLLMLQATEIDTHPPQLGNTTVTTTVTITVLDLNDNPPEFSSPSFTATIKENSPPGVSLTLLSKAQIMVSDKDQVCVGLKKKTLHYLKLGLLFNSLSRFMNVVFVSSSHEKLTAFFLFAPDLVCVIHFKD